VIFSVEKDSLDEMNVPQDIQTLIPEHLAYVEWFSHFHPSHRDSDSGLFRISKEKNQQNEPKGEIVPLYRLRNSAHLIPRYSHLTHFDRNSLSSSNILDKCSHFLFNSYSNRNTFFTFHDFSA
jgi:hypothetical protein